ncbi:MAG: hypothetical protein KIT45_06970 [Fimbriimonadia bacterium]|nr:hypothetical protein [Fimbriimonadia bacterium]
MSKRLIFPAIALFALSAVFAQPARWLLKNNLVNESSGIVASRAQKGIYWTHNDSGDGPNLYAFDRQGNDRGTFTLQGIQVRDCEDIAYHFDSRSRKGTLYLGDIGDNARKREEIVVYRVPEPKATEGGKTEVRDFETIRMKYPDQAHDCETMFVHPQTRDLYVITKSSDGESRIYRLPNPKPAPQVQTLIYTGTLRLSGGNPADKMATGGDISPDGKRIVVRTYTKAFEYTLERGKPFSAIFASIPQVTPLPLQAQGEAITYTPEGKNWIITSEGVPCEVIELVRK